MTTKGEPPKAAAAKLRNAFVKYSFDDGSSHTMPLTVFVATRLVHSIQHAALLAPDGIEAFVRKGLKDHVVAKLDEMLGEALERAFADGLREAKAKASPKRGRPKGSYKAGPVDDKTIKRRAKAERTKT